MIPFAVHHEGIPDADTPNGPQKQGRWVMAVTAGRFLLADETGAFYWQDIGECTLIRVHTPDAPIPVVPVQVGQPPQRIVQVPAMPPRAGSASALIVH